MSLFSSLRMPRSPASYPPLDYAEYQTYANRPFAYLWRYTLMAPWHNAAYIIAGLLGMVAPALLPLFFKYIVDVNANGFDAAATTWIIAGFAACLLAQQAFQLLQYWVFGPVILWRGNNRLMHELFEYIAHQRVSFFNDNFTGSTANKVYTLPRLAETLLDFFGRDVPTALVSLIVSVTFLFMAHAGLAAVILVLLAVFFACIPSRIRVFREMNAQRARARAKLNGAVVDGISNYPAMLASQQQAAEIALIDADMHGLTDIRVRSLRKRELVTGGLTFILNSIFIAIFIGCAWLFSRGLITMGDMVLCLSAGFGVVGAANTLARHSSSFVEQWGEYTEDLRTLLQRLPQGDTPGATAHTVRAPHIVVRGLRFTYPGADKPLFEGLDVEIQPGQRVGLVGVSGSGKSTLVNLLLRHYDYDAGSITLDGKPLPSYTLQSLRSQIALVPQDPSLFHRTIAQNIAYGSPHATQEQIEEAAKQAYAHEFIAALPEGYASKVGERGVKLSGGQRQRIAIARAMLRQAPLLVMDEATSSLDSQSEEYVVRAMDKLMEGKTVIVIAHRLATIARLDKILVLHHGRLVEQGTHAELLASRAPHYTTLWEKQVGGYLQE